MTADALFFGAHPDDVELSSGGLVAMLGGHGHGARIVDLTRGEAASRGTVDERAREAAAAARELSAARENLELPDLGLDRSNPEHLGRVVDAIRRHRPTLVVAPHRDDPHPDHVEASHLVERACYVAGIGRSAEGERHRPHLLLFALYRGTKRPHVVVDVTEVWDTRTRAVLAHRSQLDPGLGPATYLTRPEFLPEMEARARVLGATIGARFGEGYRMRRPFGVTDARALLAGLAPGARP